MLLTDLTERDIESPQTVATASPAETESRLMQVVRRARQIHRERGGLFGYDFDDWSEAWGEPAQLTNDGDTRRAEEKSSHSAHL